MSRHCGSTCAAPRSVLKLGSLSTAAAWPNTSLLPPLSVSSHDNLTDQNPTGGWCHRDSSICSTRRCPRVTGSIQCISFSPRKTTASPFSSLSFRPGRSSFESSSSPRSSNIDAPPVKSCASHSSATSVRTEPLSTCRLTNAAGCCSPMMYSTSSNSGYTC